MTHTLPREGVPLATTRPRCRVANACPTRGRRHDHPKWSRLHRLDRSKSSATKLFNPGPGDKAARPPWSCGASPASSWFGGCKSFCHAFPAKSRSAMMSWIQVSGSQPLVHEGQNCLRKWVTKLQKHHNCRACTAPSSEDQSYEHAVPVRGAVPCP